MRNYGYIKAKTKEEQVEKMRVIETQINNKNIDIEYITSLKKIENNSTLYIDNLCSLGDTIYQILNAFFELKSKNININEVEINMTYIPFFSQSFSVDTLRILLNHEKKNINDRLNKTKNTLYKKQKHTGRPKGKKTKSIFDKHKRIIFKELSKNSTKVKILNILKEKDSELKNTTPQALGQYIKRTEIKKKKELIKLRIT